MRLITSLLVCFGAAWLGSQFTRPALAPWYASLAKPSWTPPNWVFAPAWTTLFALMGIAAWLVWRRSGLLSLALGLFALQLAFNVTWSGLFFGLKSPAAAMGEIVFLWLAILSAAMAFWPVSRVAAWLMAPYLVWVTYAASLNFAIWRLNR
ncbi:MAG TPA: TspO/MBR family protein [Candidatus Dormibacteraeota bacterium]|nr:TspO/MBR family protein [Candidatus Dormibacteraeota bacterium]